MLSRSSEYANRRESARGIFLNETNRRVELKLEAFVWERLGNVQEFSCEEVTTGFEVMELS